MPKNAHIKIFDRRLLGKFVDIGILVLFVVSFLKMDLFAALLTLIYLGSGKLTWLSEILVGTKYFPFKGDEMFALAFGLVLVASLVSEISKFSGYTFEANGSRGIVIIIFMISVGYFFFKCKTWWAQRRSVL